MGDQAIWDAVLWIGKSYSQILCDQELEPFSQYCYIKGRREHRCYVHEAEMRGCCRKIPQIPKWLVPRKSRIFLMYRDEGSAERGLIFGYFVLQRFEYIVSRECREIFSNRDAIPWVEEVCQEIISAVLEKIESARIVEVRGCDRDFIENNLRQEFHKRWKKGWQRQLRKGCDVIIRPRPTEKTQWPSSEELLKDDLADFLEDVLEDIIQDWVEEQINKLLSAGIDPDKDPWPYPRGWANYEEPRYCSKRLKVGAIYAVDALAASITDAFAQELSREHPTTIKAGEELFRKTLMKVRQHYQEGTLTKIAPCIQDHAEIRGELVVFERPYPAFERKPRAGFRGLLCVDGDELLGEVARHYQHPERNDVHVIPFQGAKRGDIFDPAFMAQQLGINKRRAESILVLYGETLKSLKEGEELALPKIGTIKRTDSGFLFEKANQLNAG